MPPSASLKKCYLARHRTEKPLEAYQACLRIVDHYQVKRPSIKGGQPGTGSEPDVLPSLGGVSQNPDITIAQD